MGSHRAAVRLQGLGRGVGGKRHRGTGLGRVTAGGGRPGAGERRGDGLREVAGLGRLGLKGLSEAVCVPGLVLCLLKDERGTKRANVLVFAVSRLPSALV